MPGPLDPRFRLKQRISNDLITWKYFLEYEAALKEACNCPFEQNLKNYLITKFPPVTPVLSAEEKELQRKKKHADTMRRIRRAGRDGK